MKFSEEEEEGQQQQHEEECSSNNKDDKKNGNDENNNDNNCIDYRDEGGPRLSLLWCSEEEQQLRGQALYLGGEEVDGKIFCIPGHASRVLVIDTNDKDRVYSIGPLLPGKFKWLRGIVIGTNVYGLPCHADTVLKIDTLTESVTLLPIDYESFYNIEEGESKEQRNMFWKYHGGAEVRRKEQENDTTAMIYTIPQSAWHVLQIDTSNDICSLVPSQALRGKYKWYGGVLSSQDGCIYGIPHNAVSVLKIDPNNDNNIAVVSLHGNFPPGNHKWHGASVAQPCGTIVGVPNNADSVLLIQPGDPPDLIEVVSDNNNNTIIQTGRHRSDGKYKFLGATTGAEDGKVYCFPSGSEYVLKVDPSSSSKVSRIGDNLYDMENIRQNKWQNGVAVGNYIYAIPLAAETVLQIDTTAKKEAAVTTWKLPHNARRGLAKWEGGMLSSSGSIYGVPNNCKAVLKIITPTTKDMPVGLENLDDVGQN